MDRIAENSLPPLSSSPTRLTAYVPEDLIRLALAGMHDRLQAGIVVMERTGGKNTDNSEKVAFITSVTKHDKLYGYPRFCKLFQKDNKACELSCYKDAQKRGLAILRGEPPQQKDTLSRCHMGLIYCAEIITFLGQPLAVCLGGKFIQAGEQDIVKKNLEKRQKEGLLDLKQQEELLSCLEDGDFFKEYEPFLEHFKEEVAILKNVVERYAEQYRREKEWGCNQKIFADFHKAAADNANVLQQKAQIALKTLHDFWGVSYIALFLGRQPGDHSLPLFCQYGLEIDGDSSFHFNWKKAWQASGKPCRKQCQDSGMAEIESCPQSQGYAGNCFSKGLKGEGKEVFPPPLLLVPINNQYRAVLMVGNLQKANADCPVFLEKNFLLEICQRLALHIISELALQKTKQHDERRDLFVSLSAHSIKNNLHLLWDSTTRFSRHALKEPNPKALARSVEEADRIIRTIGKNITIAMAAPRTALTGDIEKSEMRLETVDLAALLHNCGGEFEKIAEEKRIVILIHDDIDTLPLIIGDPYLLDLMFANIIDNAIKYAAENTNVEISGERVKGSEGGVDIIIKDKGWGIPPGEAKRIFEAGFQTQIVKKMRRKGVGLGLYQAKQFIEMHGGSIMADSAPAYQGAPLNLHIVTFTVFLPSAKIRRRR